METLAGLPALSAMIVTITRVLERYTRAAQLAEATRFTSSTSPSVYQPARSLAERLQHHRLPQTL